MRIAIAGIIHETNTYCQGLTQLTDFHVLRADKMLSLRGTETQTGGAIDACVDLGITPVLVLQAATQPSGIIASETYHSLKTELLESLTAQLPVDGVFLDLHGAGVTERTSDLEGDLAKAVRRLVGEGVPITAAFDLHGNVTQDMADALDGVFACHEYPHVDMHHRAREAIELIRDMFEQNFRPTIHVETVPTLLPTTTTFHGIGETFRDLMRKVESGDPDIIKISFFHGFPYADVPHVGAHIVVTSRGDAQHAEKIAKTLAAELWENRESFRVVSLSAEQAVQAAMAATESPVVINETSDNCGGGTPGDGTHLLKAMLDAGLENACFGFIVDAQVAELAHKVGVGQSIEVSLGGKTDDLHGSPLELTVYIKALHDGRCLMQAMAKGSRINYGNLARLQVDGFDIVVASRRSQTFDTEPFIAVGIDVTKKDYVALKSSNHFRAGFEPIAGTIITADTPGLTTHHIEIFSRENCDVPLWPIDPDAQYIQPWL